MKDVSRPRSGKERLEAATAEWQNTFDSIADPVSIHDIDFKVVKANRAFAALVKMKPKDLIGKSCYELMHGTTEPVPNCPYKESIEYRRPSTRDFFEPHLGRHIEVTASPIFDERGKVVGCVHVTRDISERKRMETELNSLYEGEKELRAKLEDELKKRTEFTHALVHELKTPLTPIVSSSEMLTRALKEEIPLRLATNVYRGAIDLDRRIDELLEAARIEVGMVSLRLQPVDIRALVGQTVSYMMPQALGKGQTISTRFPDSLPDAEADPGRIEQVLMNLIGNAVRHTAPRSRIVVSVRQEGGDAIVEVQDNGRGISEKLQKRLFEAYYRGEDDRVRAGGLGLGLYIAKSIVELHGGHMWVRSATGKGSTFGFSLPLDNPGSRAAGRSKDSR